MHQKSKIGTKKSNICAKKAKKAKFAQKNNIGSKKIEFRAKKGKILDKKGEIIAKTAIFGPGMRNLHQEM